MNEIKINDHDQKFSLLFRHRRAGNQTNQNNLDEEEKQNEKGLDLADVIALMDQVKQDFRNELCSKH